MSFYIKYQNLKIFFSFSLKPKCHIVFVLFIKINQRNLKIIKQQLFYETKN
jgi:hypothetical protein